jgi:predicted  nucleic acid-binding Zn-ribbon protein
MLSPEELDGIQDLGYVHLIKMLSDNTPSTSTYELSEAENLAAMRTLLQEYRKQLVEAIEFMKERNEAVPQKIEDAIKHIDNQTVHWAGKK